MKILFVYLFILFLGYDNTHVSFHNETDYEVKVIFYYQLYDDNWVIDEEVIVSGDKIKLFNTNINHFYFMAETLTTIDDVNYFGWFNIYDDIKIEGLGEVPMLKTFISLDIENNVINLKTD